MSSTYYPKNELNETWDVNVSGRELLAAVLIVSGTIKHKFPQEATAQETIDMATRIDACEDDAFSDIFNRCAWLGTYKEFVAWVREWSKWLRESKGYYVD